MYFSDQNQYIRVVYADTGLIDTLHISWYLYGLCSFYGDTAGSLYVTNTNNHRILKVNLTKEDNEYYHDAVSVAGNGGGGFYGDGGLAIYANLYYPRGVWCDTVGNVFIADSNNNRVRRVDALTQIISTYAGMAVCNSYWGCSGFSSDNVLASQSYLYNPYAVSGDKDGNVFIADYYNYRIRRVDGVTKIITTVAGWFRFIVTLCLMCGWSCDCVYSIFFFKA